MATRPLPPPLAIVLTLVLIAAAWLQSPIVSAQAPHPTPPIPPSLKTATVPLPKNLDDVVKNRALAVVLGKALFWDGDVGSDRQACASCHFHAGADDRVKNQFNPGFPITTDKSFGDAFGRTGAGAQAGPNYTAVSADFPLRRLSDPENRESAVLYDSDDRFSSQGTFNGAFISAVPAIVRTDVCATPDSGNPFHVGGAFVRKVEPRNTPTMINAAFFFRNFWDGRANNVFNGVNPFGRRDRQATVWVQTQPPSWLSPGRVEQVRVELENASLASQAVGPPLSDFEMSCNGRTFADLGRKMLHRRALASQKVDSQDSVLGPYRDLLLPDPLRPKGLKFTYEQLVRSAFQDQYWAATLPVSGTFTQMEANFSLFWGLSIMLYEATLVSDQAPFDKFRGDAVTPADPYALTTHQQLGLDVFMTKGNCIACHKGPEFSGAATHLQPENQEEGLVERMRMGDGGIALYDNGFYNIGVRPSAEDPGVGGRDPFGNPLSFTKQYIDMLRGRNVPDRFQVDACTFAEPFTVDFPLFALTSPDCHGVPFDPADIDGLRTAVTGAFKTPSLRNVALTGPYFHNGGQATLGQVVAFYNRGGDHVDLPGGDTTGVPSNLDADINRLGLTREEQLALVAFLESLTDQRVACEQAPFDHPELVVPDGHPGDQFMVEPDPTNPFKAKDSFRLISAVGSTGLPGIGKPCVGSFAERLGLLQSSGVTGR
jgi:cytochrome c peroxidase